MEFSGAAEGAGSLGQGVGPGARQSQGAGGALLLLGLRARRSASTFQLHQHPLLRVALLRDRAEVHCYIATAGCPLFILQRALFGTTPDPLLR